MNDPQQILAEAEHRKAERKRERQHLKKIKDINGHAVPRGRKGEHIFLNRLKRRRRLGLA